MTITSAAGATKSDSRLNNSRNFVRGRTLYPLISRIYGRIMITRVSLIDKVASSCTSFFRASVTWEIHRPLDKIRRVRWEPYATCANDLKIRFRRSIIRIYRPALTTRVARWNRRLRRERKRATVEIAAMMPTICSIALTAPFSVDSLVSETVGRAFGSGTEKTAAIIVA